MSYETIRIDRQEGITILTLNRPHKKNAMSPQMHIEVSGALDSLAYDPETRVLVVTGAGDSFCAGQDLKEFFIQLEDKPAERDRIHRLAVEWRGRTLRLFPKPTIAAVNGYCFGGAFTIVEACDLAIAAEEAIFGLSEINFKHFPGGSVTKSLCNMLRPRDALYYAMTGKPFDGKRAAEIGFVNYAVPRDRLMDEVIALARELAEKDPVALRATKEAFKHSLSMGWDEAMNYSEAKSDQVSLLQQYGWQREGIGDFLKGEYKPGFGSKKA